MQQMQINAELEMIAARTIKNEYEEVCSRLENLWFRDLRLIHRYKYSLLCYSDAVSATATRFEGPELQFLSLSSWQV